MPIHNKVQLITYPDSLGGSLPALDRLLQEHFTTIFPGGVHILPPFPSSGDRGFSPTTYFEIDPKFGDWDDLRRIGARFPVLIDLMVNHISRRSAYFRDFVRRGRRSPHAGMFVTLDKIWPGGGPPAEDVRRIFLRRPEHPFEDISIEETGQVERLWATFGARHQPEQIDLDVGSPEARRFFQDVLAQFARHGVQILRLDAVAYVIKKPGTSCFFVEPEIYAFMDWMRAEAQLVGIELLPEVHAHHSITEKLSAHGYWVYDFALPLLVLHTLQSRSGDALAAHLRTCTPRQFTHLDCHDGIPVLPDIEDIVDFGSAQKVVENCLSRGANLSRILSGSHKGPGGFDAHQINITYHEALGRDDDAYIAARALQFFTPGVPQVYYTGLLAGGNDHAAVERAGEGRAINRHNYTSEEVESALHKPVVQRLLSLIRFRNQHPAFGGDFTVEQPGEQQLRLSWRSREGWCSLRVDLASHHSAIEYSGAGGEACRFEP